MRSLVTPFWMGTRAGQWLATRFRPFARLWAREMERAIQREAAETELVQRTVLLYALNCWAAGDFKADAAKELIPDWIAWRNAAERMHLQRERLAGRRLQAPIELRGFTFADGVKR